MKTIKTGLYIFVHKETGQLGFLSLIGLGILPLKPEYNYKCTIVDTNIIEKFSKYNGIDNYSLKEIEYQA